ncbi:MAG: hypothetical protein J6T42_04740 [Clostridia bacterium]|nr:hypothetical protein [Clostridia bacterium]
MGRFYYFVTLCGKCFGCYVDVWARNKEQAYDLVKRVYGIMNTSTVYTAKAWKEKYKNHLKYLGKVDNPEEFEFLRRKKII